MKHSTNTRPGAVSVVSSAPKPASSLSPRPQGREHSPVPRNNRSRGRSPPNQEDNDLSRQQSFHNVIATRSHGAMTEDEVKQQELQGWRTLQLLQGLRRFLLSLLLQSLLGLFRQGLERGSNLHHNLGLCGPCLSSVNTLQQRGNARLGVGCHQARKKVSYQWELASDHCGKKSWRH